YRGRMREDAAERELAPVGIGAGVQRELAPVRVDDARRHRDEPSLAAHAREEELAKAAFDQIAGAPVELRMALAELALQELRELSFADRALALPAGPERQHHERENQHDERPDPEAARPARRSDGEGDREQPEPDQQRDQLGRVAQQEARAAAH